MAEPKIRWKNPPPKSPGRGAAGIWNDRLAPVMERPGRWAVIKTHATANGAASCAANLRLRRVKRPDGIWEFRSSGPDLYARYMGEE